MASPEVYGQGRKTYLEYGQHHLTGGDPNELNTVLISPFPTADGL